MNSATVAPAISWKVSRFDEITARTLYALLQLRSEVFVVEQACVFQDMDGKDQHALHLQGFADDRLVAYARCFDAGITFAEASIGRIVTHASTRGNGIGHVLVDRAIDIVTDGGRRAQPIRIGAQARLRRFYEVHGFVDQGLPYLEDGIDHLEMLWAPGGPRVAID